MSDLKTPRFDTDKLSRTAMIRTVWYQGGKYGGTRYSLPSQERKVKRGIRTYSELVDYHVQKWLLSGKFQFSVAMVYDNLGARIHGRNGNAQECLRYFENGKNGLKEYPPNHAERDLQKKVEYIQSQMF